MNHLKSNKHRNQSLEPQNKSKQPSIDSTLQQSTSRQNRIKDVNKAAAEAFAEANIPISKFDHQSIRSFFANFVIGGESLYASNTLRNMTYDIAQEKKAKMLINLREYNSYSLIVDETCDPNGNAIMNLIFIPNINEQNVNKLDSYLIDTFKLEDCNYQTVAKEVINLLNNNSLSLDKMYGFVSDNATYMVSAFQIISIICTNAVHMTCWSHIFDLVAQTFYKSFPRTDKFVADMKKSFNYKRKMSRFYKQSTNIMPPKPVKTRWTS
jgi:hypothetical protein